MAASHSSANFWRASEAWGTVGTRSSSFFTSSKGWNTTPVSSRLFDSLLARATSEPPFPPPGWNRSAGGPAGGAGEVSGAERPSPGEPRRENEAAAAAAARSDMAAEEEEDPATGTAKVGNFTRRETSGEVSRGRTAVDGFVVRRRG